MVKTREVRYQEKLQKWEAREQRKVEERKAEKLMEGAKFQEQLEYAKMLKDFLEKYDDHRNDARLYKGVELIQRLQSRAKEAEADAKDRLREQIELRLLQKKAKKDKEEVVEVNVCREDEESEDLSSADVKCLEQSSEIQESVSEIIISPPASPLPPPIPSVESDVCDVHVFLDNIPEPKSSSSEHQDILSQDETVCVNCEDVENEQCVVAVPDDEKNFYYGNAENSELDISEETVDYLLEKQQTVIPDTESDEFKILTEAADSTTPNVSSHDEQPTECQEETATTEESLTNGTQENDSSSCHRTPPDSSISFEEKDKQDENSVLAVAQKCQEILKDLLTRPGGIAALQLIRFPDTQTYAASNNSEAVSAVTPEICPAKQDDSVDDPTVKKGNHQNHKLLLSEKSTRKSSTNKFANKASNDRKRKISELEELIPNSQSTLITVDEKKINCVINSLNEKKFAEPPVSKPLPPPPPPPPSASDLQFSQKEEAEMLAIVRDPRLKRQLQSAPPAPPGPPPLLCPAPPGPPPLLCPAPPVVAAPVRSQEVGKMSVEDKRRHVEKLIPKQKEELFAFRIAKQYMSHSFVNKHIKPWVGKKIRELVGEEEPSLVRFVCMRLLSNCDPQTILKDVRVVLDEDAELFVVRLWRLLIYKTEAKRAGLSV